MPRDFQRPFTLPEGATEVVFVRHGSSARHAPDESVELIEGQSDPPLSTAGREQALAVAERLADERVRGLFVTPLRRTSETAAPLAERIGHQPVVIPDLREIHLGDWEGEWTSRVIKRDPLSKEIFAAGRWDVIPNAEDMDAFGDRIRSGMNAVADAVGPDGVGVAVVHGGVIAEVCRQATGSHAFAFLYAENASITRLLRVRTGRWALRSFNDTAHLQASAA
jgi:2,3-bisphosphoglycerate-dependent phosphoglycerate mutase